MENWYVWIGLLVGIALIVLAGRIRERSLHPRSPGAAPRPAGTEPTRGDLPRER